MKIHTQDNTFCVFLIKIVFSVALAILFFAALNTSFAVAFAKDEGLNFVIQTEKENFNAHALTGDFSPVREKILFSSKNKRAKVMKFVYESGYTKEQALFYAFPEVYEAIDSADEQLYVAPVDAALKSIEGTGKIRIDDARPGVRLDREALVEKTFDAIMGEKLDINIKAQCVPIQYNIDRKDLEKCLSLRGSFKTSFSSSSDERKNNIRLALKSLDGVVVNPHENLSFNSTTGARQEKQGYQKAKIIKNGAFITEFGGGVCQVSTTLYNAALLSDLEIVEVHPHSLPVSYVSPCFDAMVNSGSSDLIISNSTDYPIIIATSSANDQCLVNIYGVKNNYSIVRMSEKIDDLLQITTERTKNYLDYGLTKPLAKGEEKIVCYGKPGYKARGSLQYYKDGVLVKTKKIRENTYNPTKQIILEG